MRITSAHERRCRFRRLAGVSPVRTIRPIWKEANVLGHILLVPKGRDRHIIDYQIHESYQDSKYYKHALFHYIAVNPEVKVITPTQLDRYSGSQWAEMADKTKAGFDVQRLDGGGYSLEIFRA